MTLTVEEPVSFASATFLGALQGVAEFLPISSSGHLALAQHFMGLEKLPLFFDLMLHVGTLAAVRGVVRGGVVEPLGPLPWPDGQEVLIVRAAEEVRREPPPSPAPALPPLRLPRRPALRRPDLRYLVRLAAAALFVFLVLMFCCGLHRLFTIW